MNYRSRLLLVRSTYLRSSEFYYTAICVYIMYKVVLHQILLQIKKTGDINLRMRVTKHQMSLFFFCLGIIFGSLCF